MSVPSEQIRFGGKGGALYAAYQGLGLLALPFLALGLGCRARGRRRYGERFGSWQAVEPVTWWFHGASVGEVQGILPIIESLRDAGSSERILLTATSPTGLDKGENWVDDVRLLPLDVGWCVRRALKQVVAERLVIAETELWPAFLYHALQAGIRCSIVNGRISDYTLSRYNFWCDLLTPLLQQCESVCVPNQEQRERYEDLGVAPERIVVTGHTKYDTTPKVSSDDQRRGIRRELFPGASGEFSVVVLGSIRPGEEGLWFEGFERLWSSGARIKVVVAPRHAEKFDYFWGRMCETGRRVVRWSELADQRSVDSDMLLLDTMGRLEEAYSIADLAFVGATLVNIGGHNPLEPAMYGVPVVVGPFTSVIRDVVTEMRNSGALCEIQREDDLHALLARVVSHDKGLSECGRRGSLVWERHRGASARVCSVLCEQDVAGERG